MKTDNNNTIIELENLIATAERMRNAYFWKPNTTAGGRRYYEEKNSCPTISWTENGHDYTAEFKVSCSCKNIYAHGEYTKDGKKTTLTAIKNSLKRMKSE